MRKLASSLTVVLTFLAGGSVNAQAQKARDADMVQTNEKTWVYIKPFCKFGLQFIVATQDKHDSGGASAGLVIQQVMEPGKDGEPAKPMKCNDSKK